MLLFFQAPFCLNENITCGVTRSEFLFHFTLFSLGSGVLLKTRCYCYVLVLPLFVSPGKQEVYFASRWKLVISLITGAQDTCSVASENCTCATLVPKITAASELLRLFQCVDASDCDQCLEATESGFEFQTCDFSSRAQLLDGNQAGIQTNH